MADAPFSCVFAVSPKVNFGVCPLELLFAVGTVSDAAFVGPAGDPNPGNRFVEGVEDAAGVEAVGCGVLPNKELPVVFGGTILKLLLAWLPNLNSLVALGVVEPNKGVLAGVAGLENIDAVLFGGKLDDVDIAGV